MTDAELSQSARIEQLEQDRAKRSSEDHAMLARVLRALVLRFGVLAIRAELERVVQEES